MPSPTHVIAFHLPQFHPIAQNDEWWGPGFTEWTNVVRAKQLFRGHAQPRLPSELGFYDLRSSETRAAQAQLAREHGVTAFCYWHYWFAGRRLLERPVDEVVQSGEPDFPFCLAWANQSWTGIWHGAPDRTLIEQTYPGPHDDRAHFESLLPALTDPRYVTVNGWPLLYVFRPEDLPDPAAFVRRWREMAKASGLSGLYLVAEISDLLGRGPKYSHVAEHGWDAGAYIRLPARQRRQDILIMRLRRKLRGGPEVYPYSEVRYPTPDLDGRILPSVYPNWDNTPRSGRSGLVLQGASPARFRQQLRAALASLEPLPRAERIVFIKSWNEWAEGNHLEPDVAYGRGWLEALQAEVADSVSAAVARS